MSDTDLQTETAPETQLDEDDRLRPEFVREVLARVDDGDDQGARDLVSPLHPDGVSSNRSAMSAGCSGETRSRAP